MLPCSDTSDALTVHPAALLGWERLRPELQAQLTAAAWQRTEARMTDDPDVYSIGVEGVRILVDRHQDVPHILAVATPREIQAFQPAP